MTIRPTIIYVSPENREEWKERNRKKHIALSNAYERKHKKSYRLTVNKKYEREIIKWLEANRPYQTAIKRLIREEIAREKERKKKAPD